MVDMYNKNKFKECFKNISPGDKKIKKGNYLSSGKIPVVDQGEKLIGGYTNDISSIQDMELPVIIFGDHTRRFKYVNFKFAAGADGIKILRVNRDILDEKFAYYQLLQASFTDKGYSRHFQYLKKVHIWAPKNKKNQRQIVEKIETQFTRLDAIIKSLRAIKGKLKVYRKSVLRAAFEGKFTNAYRKQTDYDSQSFKARINEIIRGRRVKSSSGKSMFDKYDLEKFPKEWMLVKLVFITKKITDGTHKTPKYCNDGVPFISVKDVRDGKVYFDDCKYISVKEHRDLFKRCNPESGDILITKSGTIGRIAVVERKGEFSLFVSVALIKPDHDIVDSKYLAYVLEDYVNRIDIDKQIKGALLKNFHLEDLRECVVPLCVIDEQHMIVSEIDSKFSVIDKVDEIVNNALVKAKRLRRSILKAAFEGKLIKKMCGART